MRLLGWYQLEAKQSTAAILYPAPVRVASIRVFPTGSKPFHQSPDIVALTEPEAFFLDVFFNTISVQPAPVQDSQEKRAAPKNVLASTRIAYAGDQTEFIVDMGLEFATRLIIFNGEFKSLFVAIYGDIVISEPPELVTYEPKRLPVLKPSPLAPTVDPANSSKPTLLAEQLLHLLPNSPELSVATRLIFALKPENEDWDHPDFPNLFSDLDVTENPDLDNLITIAGRPIRDDISQDAITTFAMAMHDSLGSNPPDDAYYIAKLLSMAASQQTRFSRTLLQHLDLPEVFNERTLDETTVYCLRDAAANIEIARYFREDEPFFNSLEKMLQSPKTDKLVQKAVKKLLTRIRGWQSFEDALINADGDFINSASFLKEITAGEHAIGCWLECMINHETLAASVAQVPAPGEASNLPPLLFDEQPSHVSHGSFRAFVKALLAVSTLLASLAWADSIGSDQCRERALALLVLWQGVDGYREIVNHCLLLRQITKRLGWNKSDDIPRKLGTYAERLLVGLAKDPQAMLSDDLITTVLSLEPPFSYITTDELMEIGKLARVARDGLSSAIEELTFTSFRPFSLRRLRVLRVSLAIIAEELTYDDGERHVAESFWSERSRGVGPTLVSVLADIADDLNHHFAIQPPPRMNQALSELLFRTANDILVLLTRFTPTYPLISHDLRMLTTAVANLYACADAAGFTFSTSSSAFLAAQRANQNCIETLRMLSKVVQAETITSSPQTILRALLSPTTTKDIRDPVHHNLQVYDLIMNVLPQESCEDGASWAKEVFPKVLAELKAFSHLLDPETRATFLERLVSLDMGEIGIGEWLLVEQMKELLTALHSLAIPLQGDYKLVLQYQINSFLRFCDLVMSSPQTGEWGVSSFSANEDLSQLLANCLSLILDYNISSFALTELTRRLVKHASQFAPDIRFSILLLALRHAQADPFSPDALEFILDILKSLPATSIVPERLQSEVGRLMSIYSDQSLGLNAEVAGRTLQILEWLASHGDVKLATLASLSTDRFDYLVTNLASALPADRQSSLGDVKNKLIIDEDELLTPPPTELPDTLIMPLHAVEHLISPPPVEPPSTPKRGTKTPDILGVVISPPAAVLRSPAATGLTKTYLNNDFRQLRQVPSTRMNTSRLPSTHVDEFEHLSQSPELLSAARIDVTGTGSMFPGFMPGMVG